MTPPHGHPSHGRRRGLALPAMLAALVIAGVVAGTIGQGSTLLARMSREVTYTDGARMTVKQALFQLVTESADSDGDGWPESPAMDTSGTTRPSDGGAVPAGSAAPKSDPWGTPLGYCSWDNGGTSSSTGRLAGDSPATPGSVVLAVISAGPDKAFNTNCAQARGGSALGDDQLMLYTAAQVSQGVGGTVYWGDPVTDYVALTALPAASLHNGEQRIQKDTGQVWRWDGAVWKNVNGISYVDPSGRVGVGAGVSQGQSLFAALTADRGSTGEAVRVGSGNNDQSISFGGKASIATTGNAVNMILNAHTQSSQLVLAGSGYVGVGTANPLSRLSVASIGGTGLESVHGGAEVHLGTQLAAPGTTGEVARLALQPFGHSGGPFNFFTRDLGSNAYLDIRYGSAPATASLISLVHGGNVGIGNSAPTQKLDVGGNVRIQGALYDSSNSAGSTGSLLTSSVTGTQWQTVAAVLGSSAFLQGGNSFGTSALLGTNDAHALSLRTAGTERLRIDAAGLVGIGTSSPQFALDVVGDVQTSGNLYVGGTVQAGALSAGGFKAASAGTVAAVALQPREREVANFVVNDIHWSTTSGLVVEAHATYFDSGYKKYYIEAGYRSAEVRPVESRGDLAAHFGLRLEKAELVGSISGQPSYRYRLYAQADYYSQWKVTIRDSAMALVTTRDANVEGELAVKAVTSATDVASISNAGVVNSFEGNVGIGTTTPGAKLDVYGAGTTFRVFDSANSDQFLVRSGSGTFGVTEAVLKGQGQTLSLYANPQATASVGTYATYAAATAGLYANSALALGSGNTERLRIDAAGNVGMGTTAPSTKLHIDSGTLYDSGLRLSQLGNPAMLGATLSRAIGVDSSGKVMVTNAIGVADNRAVDLQPQDRPAGLYADFKQNATNGLNDGSAYNGVLTFRSYGNSTDLSGGYPMQLAYTANGNLWTRMGTSATTWGSWNKLLTAGGSGAWNTTGNAGTSASTNFIGTTDAVDFVARTNNTERLRITSAGNVGISTSTPGVKLDIAGGPIAVNKDVIGVVATAPLHDSPAYITVFTKIPFVNEPAVQLRIRGYGYFTPADSEVTLSWYQYNNTFYGAGSVTKFHSVVGKQAPSSIRLGVWDDAGTPRVAIEYANDSRYWTSYHIDAYRHDEAYGTSHYSGWTVASGAFSGSITNIVAVPQTGPVVQTSTGQVGIGTTSPNALLDVSGTGITGVIRAYASTGVPSLKLEAASGNPYLQMQSGAIIQDLSGGALRARAAAGGFITFDTNGANERMRIDAAGNVGIGTASPASKLDIRSNSASYYQALHIQNEATGGGQLTVMPFAGSLANAVAGDVLITNDVGNILISPNNASKGIQLIGGAWTNTPSITVSSSGRVGLGTTTPGMPLDISLNSGSTPSLQLYNTSTTDGRATILFRNDRTSVQQYEFGLNPGGGGDKSFMLRNLTAGTYPLSITATGNTGLGTTSPTERLTVGDGSTATQGIHINAGNTPVLRLQRAGINKWGIFANYTGSDSLDFYSYGATTPGTKLMLTKDGNLGLGTTTPGSPLTVVGTGNAAVDITGLTRMTTVSQGATSTERFYPNVASLASATTVTGAWVVHTPIPRTSNRMFKLRVHGYWYGTSRVVDFTVVGYPHNGASYLGNVDGVLGRIVNIGIIDNGTDGLNKYIGVDAAGNVAVALGDVGSSIYYGRLSVDAWITQGTSEFPTGWSIDHSTTPGFGWGDITGPLTPGGNSTWTGTTNYLAKFTSAGTLGNSLIFDNGTNVGIGTSTPSKTLDVIGTASISSNLTLQGQSAIWNNASAMDIQAGSPATAGMRIGTTVVTPIVLYTNGIERARLDGAGNLGIGTTAPAARLNVAGTGRVLLLGDSNLVDQYVALRNGGSGGGFWGMDTLANGGNGAYVLQAGLNKSLQFAVNNDTWGSATPAMAISMAGSVGIGTVAPNASLEIVPATDGAPALRLSRRSVPTTQYLAALETASGHEITGFSPTTNAKPLLLGVTTDTSSTPLTAGQIYLGLYTMGSERMRVDMQGNVGIGTNAPVYKLHVQNATTWGTTASALAGINPLAYFDNGNTGNGAIVIKAHSVGAGNVHGALRFATSPDMANYSWSGIAGISTTVSAAADTLAFYTSPNNTSGANSTERMRLTMNGNLLINTTIDNGVDKLQVAGTISAYGLNVPNQGKTVPLSVRGTGANNSAVNQVVVGSTVVASNGPRGLTLVVLNKSDYSLASSATYDTYGFTAQADNLATALNAITNAQIGVLMSYDAWEQNVSANLKAAALSRGLTRLVGQAGTGARAPYAAVFDGATAAAVATTRATECVVSSNASAPYCDLRGWLSNGAFEVGGGTAPNALALPDGSGTAVFVNATGNVGVGLTTPSERLHLTDGRLRVGAAADSAVLEGGSGFGSKLRLNYSDGVANTLLAGNNDSYLNVNHGRLGVGTASPSYKLTVSSPNTSDTLKLISVAAGGQARLNIEGGAGGLGQIDNAIGDFFLTNASTGNAMIFRTENTERMRITNAGLVGIGTAGPSSRLSVVSSASEVPSTTYGATTGVSFNISGRELAIGTVSTAPYATYLQSKRSDNTANDIAINPAGGNVGIGNTAPGAKLHVLSNDVTYPTWNYPFRAGNSNAGGGNFTVTAFSGAAGHAVAGDTMLSTESGHLLMSPNINAKDIKFIGGAWANPVSMIIKDGGNVGIGTTTPSSKLSVYELGGSAANRMGRFVQGYAGAGTNAALDVVSAVSGGSALDVGHWAATSGNWAFRAYGNASRSESANVSDAGSIFLMGVRADGAMGIGSSTIASNARLQVETPENVWGTVLSRSNVLVGGMHSNGGVFTIGSASGTQMAFPSTGNVGIGTAAPARYFEVAGTGGTANVRFNSLSGTTLSTTLAANDGIVVADTHGDLTKRSVSTVVSSAIASNDYGNNNLAYNGDFETGTADGWTAWALPTIVTGGYAGNYAAQYTGPGNIVGNTYIPVNPITDVLQLEVYVKKTVAGTSPGIFYFGYIAYDANKAAITTSPCGTYCYFAASASTVPVDGSWHKYSATTTGEGTTFPNFPVGTKYVRVLGLINYNASADAVTLVDHIRLQRINHGPLYVGNNYSSANMVDQQQFTKLYTHANNNFIIEAPGTGALSLKGSSSTSQGTLKYLRGDGITMATIGFVDPTAVNSAFRIDSTNGNDILFAVNSNEKMRLTNVGALGIGTSAPAGMLSNTATNTGDFSGNGIGPTGFNWMSNGVGYVGMLVNTDATAGIRNGLLIKTMANDSGSFPLQVNVGANSVLAVRGDGNVGIGTASPGYKLHVAGAVGATAFTNTSDIRFKRDIAPLEGAVARIALLRGVNYRWRKDEFPQRGFDDKVQIGFVAQELETVLPELVSTDPEGFKSVAYTGVIPLVVEAVKELHQTMEPLLPLAKLADKLKLGNDTVTVEVNAPMKVQGPLLVTGDFTAATIKAKKVVADEVQAGRVNSGELQFTLEGGWQRELLELPTGATYTVVISGPDGSFVHATVLNTGGLVQISAKHQNGLDLQAQSNRLRVLNTGARTKQLAASWMRTG